MSENKLSYAIRPASLEDLHAVVALVNACSIAEGGILPALSGSISETSGSLSGNGGSTGQSSDLMTGSTGGSAEVITGSFGELTEVNGSLTALTGSLENGSMQGTFSTNLGSEMGALASLESFASLGESGTGSLLPVLALGASAGGGAMVATAAANGTLALPPLPGLPPLPTVCDLPQAQVDQLAGLGSVDAQQCPEPGA